MERPNTHVRFLLLMTTLLYCLSRSVDGGVVINDSNSEDDTIEKNQSQISVRRIESSNAQMRQFATDSQLSDIMSQVSSILRDNPTGTRMFLQRTKSFDGTPVIIRKSISYKGKSNGNDSDDDDETVYDLLDDVKNPYVPPETAKVLVKPKGIKIQQAPDGGYIANGYHIPANFKLDASKLEEFTQEVVAKHNQLRALHNTPPLQLDRQLSRYSQWWANQLLKTKSFHHSPHDKRPVEMGENIYWAGVPYMPGNFPVEIWYEEGKTVNYNYNTNRPTNGAGHFTQLLWKRSNRIGVGIASDPKRGMYVVCNYTPPGNYDEQYRANVLRPNRSSNN